MAGASRLPALPRSRSRAEPSREIAPRRTLGATKPHRHHLVIKNREGSLGISFVLPRRNRKKKSVAAHAYTHSDAVPFHSAAALCFLRETLRIGEPNQSTKPNAWKTLPKKKKNNNTNAGCARAFGVK